MAHARYHIPSSCTSRVQYCPKKMSSCAHQTPEAGEAVAEGEAAGLDGIGSSAAGHVGAAQVRSCGNCHDAAFLVSRCSSRGRPVASSLPTITLVAIAPPVRSTSRLPTQDRLPRRCTAVQSCPYTDCAVAVSAVTARKSRTYSFLVSDHRHVTGQCPVCAFAQTCRTTHTGARAASFRGSQHRAHKQRIIRGASTWFCRPCRCSDGGRG